MYSRPGLLPGQAVDCSYVLPLPSPAEHWLPVRGDDGPSLLASTAARRPSSTDRPLDLGDRGSPLPTQASSDPGPGPICWALASGLHPPVGAPPWALAPQASVPVSPLWELGAVGGRRTADVPLRRGSRAGSTSVSLREKNLDPVPHASVCPFAPPTRVDSTDRPHDRLHLSAATATGRSRSRSRARKTARAGLSDWTLESKAVASGTRPVPLLLGCSPSSAKVPRAAAAVAAAARTHARLAGSPTLPRFLHLPAAPREAPAAANKTPASRR